MNEIDRAIEEMRTRHQDHALLSVQPAEIYLKMSFSAWEIEIMPKA